MTIRRGSPPTRSPVPRSDICGSGRRSLRFRFFWQAAQEVEEERALGRNLAQRRGATASAWPGSLDRQPHRAKKFYGVLTAAMILGLGLNYGGFDAITLLFTTAVINGMLAPPLVLIVLLLTRDPRVMGTAVNSRLVEFLGWVTFIVMSLAAVGLVVPS